MDKKDVTFKLFTDKIVCLICMLFADGDNSDDENDQDNADKQMGDTDNAAEKYVSQPERKIFLLFTL